MDAVTDFGRITRAQARLLHELFEEQVERTPNAVALKYGHQSVTYAELNRKANRLARYLRALGVGPDQLVGICLERSIEMLVCVLAVWKAGGAYLPLNVSHPTERTIAILEDAQAPVVLTESRFNSAALSRVARVAALDEEWCEIAGLESTNLDSCLVSVTPEHLAYVMYTSGSTGKPNGVMIAHRNVASYWPVVCSLYRYPLESVRIALNAPFTFDVSLQQFILLLSGCTLYVIPEHVRHDARELLRFVDQHQIEAIDCTPSQLNIWISAGLLESAGYHLRTVIVGGEAMDAALWARLTRHRDVDFYNVYGPTECTVFCTTASLRDETAAEPHIGRPTENAYIHILDEQLHPVGVGVTGEICIGGKGVARGYLNRPELNAARFITDPVSQDVQARIYKTGDLGRWRTDGTIEYCGRNDHQIKLRGFRIEPGEIEARIRHHSQIADAVVIAREDSSGDRRLVAYVTPRAGSEPSSIGIDDLRASLKAELPDYMLPNAFVVLTTLPLTANGKLDRQALPAPEPVRTENPHREAPRGKTEQTLAQIWREVLRVENIGRDDNFLALGGHSMLGMRLLMDVATRFAIPVAFPDIGHYPTIRRMAEFVERQTREARSAR
jgi:amino acid adenylation domain-containing protein